MSDITNEQVQKMHSRLFGGFRGLGEQDMAAASKSGVAQADFDELKKRMDPTEWAKLEEYRRDLMPKIQAKGELSQEEKNRLREIYEALADDTLNAPDASLDASLAANTPAEGSSGGSQEVPPGANNSTPLNATPLSPPSTPPSTPPAGPTTATPGGTTQFDADLASYDTLLTGLRTQLSRVQTRVSAGGGQTVSSQLDSQLQTALTSLIGQIGAVNDKDPKIARDAAKALNTELKALIDTMEDLQKMSTQQEKDALALDKQRLDILDRIQKLQANWLKTSIDLHVRAATADRLMSEQELRELEAEAKQKFAFEKGDTYKAQEDARQARLGAQEDKANLQSAELQAQLPYAYMAGEVYAAEITRELMQTDARVRRKIEREQQPIRREIEREARRRGREFNRNGGGDAFGFLGPTEEFLVARDMERRDEAAHDIYTRRRERANSVVNDTRTRYSSMRPRNNR